MLGAGPQNKVRPGVTALVRNECLYCLYRTNTRNRERPVGRRENCQINDIHKEEKTPPTRPNQPSPHPRMSSCELSGTGGGVGRSKPQKLNSIHPEMLRGEGRGGTGQQVDPRCSFPARPAPLPQDEMLRPGSGPKPTHATHTHTHVARTRLPLHTHTHPPCHLHPRCTGIPTDTNSPRHTHTCSQP